MSHIHVIGAGLAGLSAALSLTAAGHGVTLHESGPAAGGRCRSYFDRELGIRIDNGNHLLLTGNKAAFGYIREIGAGDRLNGPRQAVFPFVDLKTGDRWAVRPNRGPIPWWVFSAARRVPETRLSDYLGLRHVLKIKNDTVVADAMRRGRLYWRLVEPLAVAALNTRPQAGLARLLAAVMRETLLRGGGACIPRFPAAGLSEALIDPAIAILRQRGAEVLFNNRITSIEASGDRVTGLTGTTNSVALAADDAVVLAVPPWVAASLLPELVTPNAFEAIVNIHFHHEPDLTGPLGKAGFLGVLSGTAEWIFAKAEHLSVTISAANNLVDDAPSDLAAMVWHNVRAALELPAELDHAMPPFRVIKEKRATFAATAAQDLRRPAARTPLTNLVLAGDWTRTGLPATIEGAIRSGRTAAAVLLAA